jgi:hypothetical protein
VVERRETHSKLELALPFANIMLEACIIDHLGTPADSFHASFPDCG